MNLFFHFLVKRSRLGWTLFALCWVAGRASNVDPDLLAVRYSCKASGTADIVFKLHDEIGSPTLSEQITSTESTQATAWLKPRKEYWVDFQISTSADHGLSFSVPDGYALYINGIRTDYLNRPAGSISQEYLPVELRPAGDGGVLEAGAFTGIGLGQAVSWELGLGTLRSGHSADRISFWELDLTINPNTSTGPASRDRLHYTKPIGTWQVNVIKDGSLNQTLRQIASPMKVVDFLDDPAGGYWVKYYNYDDTDLTGGVYIPKVGKLPWRQIRVESPASNQLKITEINNPSTQTDVPTSARVSLLSLTSGSVASGNFVWTLQEGDGTQWLRTTTHASTKSGATREDLVTVTGADAVTIVGQTKNIYTAKEWGEVLTQVVANPSGGANTLTSTYTYYEDITQKGNYAHIKSISGPTNNWTAYAYYDDWDRRGRVQYQYQPFMDSPSAVSLDPHPLQGRVSSFDYVLDPNSGRFSRPSLSQVMVNNILTSKTVTTYDNSADTGLTRLKADVHSYGDAANFQWAHVEHIDSSAGTDDQAGDPYLIQNPDFSQVSQSSSGGSYDSPSKVFTVSGDFFWRELKVHGSSNSSGAEPLSSYDSQNFAPIYLIPNKSTLEILVRNVAGYVIRTETRIYTGSSTWSSPVVSEDFSYDPACRLVSRVTGTGASTTNTYTNGRLSSVASADGTNTQFTYDAMGRISTQNKAGVPMSGSFAAQGNVTTTTTYDAADHVTKSEVTGGALVLTSSATYDLGGRLTSTTAPGPLATTTAPSGYTTRYDYSADKRFVTVTLPGGATKITEQYCDGNVRQVVGTAQVATFFSYGPEPGTGRMIQQQTFNFGVTRWINTYSDWLGRKVQESSPDANGAFVSRLWHYNNAGHLDRSSQPGMADTLYLYDTLGDMVRSGLYIDGGAGQLNPASNDRIVDSAWTYFNSGGNWWRRETSSGYATAGNGALSLLGKVETQLNGFSASGGTGFIRLSRADSFDPDGNVTTRFTEVNFANKITLSGILTPSSTTTAIQTSYNELVVSDQSTLGTTVTYGYDSLGRPITTNDPRLNVTTTTYRAGSSEVEKVYDGLASVALATNANTQPTITYHYDGAGRPDIVTDGAGKSARCDYNDQGQKLHEWGDNITPVEHVYNPYGQQLELHTYRGGTGWTGSNWPTATVGTVDITKWVYKDTTGLIDTKTGALGAGTTAPVITYTFSPAGQMLTRKGARGIVTTYTYSGITGELTGVVYSGDPTDQSNNTSPVSYQYTRLGQISVVGDATGSRSFNYNPGAPWQLSSESLPAFFSASRQPLRQLTHLYESAGTGTTWNNYSTKLVAGRSNGFDLGVSGNTSRDLHQIYIASTLGQVAGLTSSTGGAAGQDFVYTYNSANPSLLAGYTAGGNFAVSRSYETNRDLLGTIQSSWGATPITRFDYTTNALGQRLTSKQSGTAYSDYYANQTYSSVFNNYRYNDRGELESAALYRGAPSTSGAPVTADELPGHHFEYRYDSIGNRLTEGDPESSNGDEVYTANGLNQYDEKQNNSVRVLGTAAPAARVAVQNAPATRRLDNVWSTLVSAKSNAVQNTPNIYAAIPGTGGAPDTVSQKTTNPYLVPPLAQFFKYDLDGNLNTDNVWIYTYDAENRLTTMVQDPAAIGSANIPAVGARKLVFTYDFLGRRVEKTVYGGWDPVGKTFSSTPILDAKFIYDGWNLVAELDSSGTTITRSYAWGLDLSGSPTASGGVGALLQITNYAGGNPTSIYDPTYDGNGNIVSLVNASSGALGAVFEYDPFGNYLRAEVIETAAGDSSFRFSTKYTDAETSLVYYGMRYYSPSLGRFINKDPIEESGGVNLYGFCRNNGVNAYDYLGMDPERETRPQWVLDLVQTLNQSNRLGMAGYGSSLSDQWNAGVDLAEGRSQAAAIALSTQYANGTYAANHPSSGGGQSRTYSGTVNGVALPVPITVTNDATSVPANATMLAWGTNYGLNSSGQLVVGGSNAGLASINTSTFSSTNSISWNGKSYDLSDAQNNHLFDGTDGKLTALNAEWALQAVRANGGVLQLDDWNIKLPSVGHSMLSIPGTKFVIASSFPDPHGMLGAQVMHSYDQTFSEEPGKHSPNSINVPNQAGALAAALFENNVSKWFFAPMFNPGCSTNCVYSTDTILQAGGVSTGWPHIFPQGQANYFNGR